MENQLFTRTKKSVLLCSILIFLLFGNSLNAQTITGSVTNESGEGLNGASVAVMGTNLGTNTDEDGKFSINDVPEGSVLRISYIGYATQEVPAKNGLKIIMIESSYLDEVVITGVFDERTKMSASVAISSINEEALKAIVPNSSVDLLKNLPGVYVNTASGEIGNSIYTRGLSAGSSTRDGNFRYVSMQEDGLPVIGISGSINPDMYLRADATIARVEAVRGGSAAILGPNAPGGIFNYISKTGGEEFAGEVSVRGGIGGKWEKPLFQNGCKFWRPSLQRQNLDI